MNYILTDNEQGIKGTYRGSAHRAYNVNLRLTP